MGMIVEEPRYRDKRFVFEDRTDAGRMLVRFLSPYRGADAIVLAIPSGGIPVGTEIAKGLGLSMDVVIVRKLQIPYEPEAGFGAVDLNGGLILNDDLMTELGLTAADSRTSKKEGHRSGSVPGPGLEGRPALSFLERKGRHPRR